MKILTHSRFRSTLWISLSFLILAGCNRFGGTFDLEVEPIVSPEPELTSPAPEQTPGLTAVVGTATPGPLQEAIGLVFSDVSAGETWLIDLSGTPQRLFAVPRGTLSPGNGKLLFEREDDLWIADLDEQTEMNLTNTPERLERDGQWWPANPDLIVFNSVDLESGWGLSAGKASMIATDGSGYQVVAENSSFWQPGLSPDGETIAYDTGQDAWLYRLDTGVTRFEVSEYGLEIPPDFKIGSPSWSPDGAYLAWWVGGSFAPQGEWVLALAVFDLRAKSVQLFHEHQPLGGSEGWLPPALWNPAGDWMILATHEKGRATELWAIRRGDGETVSLGPGANPLWSPDGRRLVFLRYDPQGGSFLESQVLLVERDIWQPVVLELPRGSQPIQWVDR